MTIDVNDYNHITGPVLASAIDVHKTIGAGLLESTYMPCLQFELRRRHLRFEIQRPIAITYKGMALDASYRIDLVVEDVLVVEVKSVATILPVHEAQILTYMRLADCPVGLLINFNVPRLVDGVKRKVNPDAIRRCAPRSGPPDRLSSISVRPPFPPLLRVDFRALRTLRLRALRTLRLRALRTLRLRALRTLRPRLLRPLRCRSLRPFVPVCYAR